MHTAGGREDAQSPAGRPRSGLSQDAQPSRGDRVPTPTMLELTVSKIESKPPPTREGQVSTLGCSPLGLRIWRHSWGQVTPVARPSLACPPVAASHRLPKFPCVMCCDRPNWDAVRADARKTPPKRVRGVSKNPLRTLGPLLPRLMSRSSAGRRLRTCHWPG